jgi:hypothetical protein
VSYSSEVLADSPWGYWKTDEASGSLADSSGNGRTMTVTGAPTYAQTGPDGASADAILWPSGSHYAQVSAGSTVNPAGFTLEAWVYLTASPTGTTQIIAQGDNATGTTFTEYGLGITSAGLPFMYIHNGTARFCTGSTALSLNAWHHVVGRAGVSGGMSIRVDKATTGTLAQNILSATYGRSIWLHASGYSNQGASQAVTIARPALYMGPVLSDARLDAHYDAMFLTTGSFAATLPKVTAAFSGTYRDVGSLSATLPKVAASLTGTYTAPQAGTFAATLPTPTADFAGTYTAPVNPTGVLAAELPAVTGSFAGDYHPHEAGTFEAVLPFPTAEFTGTYTPGLESGTFDAVLPVVTASFDGTYHPLGDHGDFAAVLPLVVASFAGTYDGPVPTDTSNSHNGRRRGGRATTSVDRPPAPTPPGRTYGPRVDKAIAYPVPTMVDGRPT